MAVIRQRKRNLALAMVIGLMLGAVPFALFGIHIYIRAGEIREELHAVKGEISSRKLRYMYILKNDKQKGDEILHTDLMKCEVYCSSEMPEPASANDLVGKKLKLNTAKMSIINSNMVYKEDISDDVRLHEYSFLDLHDEISEGSYIDIRITFPNGEDYIVAEHKKVMNRKDSSLCVYVTEEEILLMSSAKVDLDTFDGTKVYAILYAKDYQLPASKDYPANEYVCELADWDPNIIKKVFTEEGRLKRKNLEQNMADFLSGKTSV